MRNAVWLARTKSGSRPSRHSSNDSGLMRRLYPSAAGWCTSPTTSSMLFYLYVLPLLADHRQEHNRETHPKDFPTLVIMRRTAGRVLPQCVPKEALPLDRRAAKGSGCLVDRVQ